MIFQVHKQFRSPILQARKFKNQKKILYLRDKELSSEMTQLGGVTHLETLQPLLLYQLLESF